MINYLEYVNYLKDEINKLESDLKEKDREIEKLRNLVNEIYLG